ncbi:MAG: viologen exporter family transport system ATP-binding protein [Candidatus Parcubacteria bacterium]|jgi:ABC-2 type transport system ATP-binding protein|nr:viologen exporter family transport system ATP-binding protein [Candidatus Parcubacteria bacterium]
MSIAIHVRNLVKQYTFHRKEAGLLGTFKSLFMRQSFYANAVQDISFEVEEGEIVGFLGPNGAGKTTTLKMLSGILYPTSGTIEVLGMRPQDRRNELKRQFGIVMGQKEQLTRVLPAMDSFKLFKEFYSLPDTEYQETLNELVDLLEVHEYLDIPVRKLSLGQRMKCELIGALLHNPRVLFLDEPTIGLDVVAQKNIRDFIKKYNQKRKTTIMLTSHYMDDIKELCERVIIINFGRIIYDGKLSTLITEYATDKLIRVSATESIPKEVLERFGTVEEYQGVRATILVPRKEVKAIASKLMASDLPIDDIGIDEMPIDDVIRAIFAAH